ncbi:MAG: LEA type 2 family protein [Desulfomicrobium sp.]|nr:LEA type 2 family protein [Pseudomonadota bacterium]MBV1714123.1 LEA type 2 family protein [Desulfomicrobium sp.]MBU4571660.1 LEA type 2 family protein [Pseudomonadota bacterium]MBU4595808.1 LEA type 2 family protein [Pseudomonadota bacterium]MBV1721726.1 LEA type 2 family protein [Desulfomicrobium sp.]
MTRLVLLLAGFFVFALSGCAHFGKTVESPTVRLVNVMPASSTLFEQRVVLTLRIVNPNPFALSWTGVKVNTRFNDMDLLPAVSSENGRVEALGESVLKVEASASTLDLLRQVLAFQGGQGKLTYALDGVLYQGGLNSGTIPFSTEGALWDSGDKL